MSSTMLFSKHNVSPYAVCQTQLNQLELMKHHVLSFHLANVKINQLNKSESIDGKSAKNMYIQGW